MTNPASITDADRERIAAAVTAAEARSAGEIVTILTERSDGYADIALIWSTFVAFLALTALAIAPDFCLGTYDRLTGGWVQQWYPHGVFVIALIVATLLFAGMWLLQLWQPLKFWLIPGPVKHARVRARAITCFKVGANRRTRRKTGILRGIRDPER